MTFGCVTCLQVITNVWDAFYFDSSSGSEEITLGGKLMEIVPGLVLDLNNACLCRSCVNVVNAAFHFKQTALESRSKILSYLKEAPNQMCVGIDDIARWYGSADRPSAMSDFDVDIKPNTQTLVQTFVLNNDHYEQVSRRNQNDDTAPSWEPPPSAVNDQNDNQPVFQSAPVTNFEHSEPVLKLKCRLCNYSCDENCMHAFHMILHENPRPPYKCGRCPSELLSRELLLDHLARHTSETPYKCTVCFFTTNRYKRMKTHQDTHQKQFYCSICKQRFEMERQMRIHIAEVHRDKLKCDLCKYQSKNDILLQQHKREHLKCRTCGHAFQKLQDVEAHCLKMGHRKK